MTTNIPQYVADLYNTLMKEYSSVRYAMYRTGDYTVEDRFTLDGLCIVIDRLDIDTLAEEDMSILLNSIRDMYIVLRELNHVDF